ncbi:LysR family transcriptional regulator [Govanella unica]|uniref:LysR family transcriptional regulator n=1 Tax=Govanella unica TaxID=2975056 RepID=A0A9X3TYV3_9PROT|nr:LysR family transcriptional regulator [Govania unica]MDA5194217.1 LysR family transcriptional regulator [Govania unica]
MKKLSLSRIHYFYMTHKAGSMRAASDLLNVAPSSISRQISLLEEEVGLPLIERGRRSIKLTEAGDSVIDYYREELALEETFRENIENLRGQRRGNIQVAMGEGFVSNHFASIVADFIAAHPGISINVEIAATNDLARMVSEDDVHFGLTFEAPADPRLSRRLSLPAPICFMVAPGHPLAKQDTVQLKDLGNELLALPGHSFRIRQMLEQAQLRDGVHLKANFTSNSLALLKDFTYSGKGSTILPQVAALAEIAQGSLVSIPIDNPILAETTVNVMTRRGRQLPTAIISFMNLVSSNLSQGLKR